MTVWRRARVVGDSPSRGGSFARALPGGSPTGAAAAAHDCPATGRSRSRPQRPPMPRDASWSRPSASRHVCQSPCESHRARDGTPRIVRVGPSNVKGTRRSFLTASQKLSSGPTLERWSLCRPSGPDGEDQAGGQAR